MNQESKAVRELKGIRLTVAEDFYAAVKAQGIVAKQEAVLAELAQVREALIAVRKFRSPNPDEEYGVVFTVEDTENFKLAINPDDHQQNL